MAMKHLRRKYGIVSKVRKLSKLRLIPTGYLQKSKYNLDDEILGAALRKLEDGGYLLSAAATGNPLRRSRMGTKRNFMYDGSFHEAIGPVLVIAQCFGFMPVQGVKSRNVKGLSFSWNSYRTVYTLVFLCVTILDSIFSLQHVLKHEVDIRNLEPFIFHISNMISVMCFLRLAKQWPLLMQHWALVEQELPTYPNQKEKDRLGVQIKMITFVAMMLSLMEHLLSTISAIHFANFCPSRGDTIESYFVVVVPQVFVFWGYSTWLACVGKIENVLLTFGWSFTDMFVMLMGVGLSSLFRRVQKSMDDIKGKPTTAEFWSEHRTQYRNICSLIEEVDDAISKITMLSFANNLYFVCIQLLKSMNTMPSIAHAVYFYFSLIFLLARTLAVSLYLSEVNEQAKKPLMVLKCVPKESWCAEVERFADEISKDVVALTGMKFFNVTRTLVLTIAGTIVTYELVLIQFHEDQKFWSCGDDH